MINTRDLTNSVCDVEFARSLSQTST